MDAFSLALSIGTLYIPKKKRLLLSFIVGIFHFFMPLIGMVVGKYFTSLVHVSTDLLSTVIFLYIAYGMYKEYRESDYIDFDISIYGMLIFALGVSLDAFGVGFTLVNNNYLFLIPLVFAVFSLTFTLLGLSLGKVLNDYIGKYAIIFGISIMLILSIFNFVKFIPFG